MTFLELQPLSQDLLPAALALDQRCFNGLWTFDGYQRELDSPSSELLVLVEKGAEREGADGRQATAKDRKREASETEAFNIQNIPAPSNHRNSPARPSPSLLALGCYWAILEEAHITILAVDPTYQRQGLGQALLYALLTSARDRGLERATLEVRISNHSALSLYKKFDFREAGHRRHYYPDTGEDALVLWRGGMQTPDFAERLLQWQQQICDRLSQTGWQWLTGG